MNIASTRFNYPAASEAKTGIRSDIWFVSGVIAFVLALTTLPYVFAYLTTPEDKVFMGILLNVPDHVQYFSWMRELTHSHLAANKLTPEYNAPLFFNLLWWGMGRIGQTVGLDYAGMFQVLRVSSTIMLLLLVYHVCGRYFQSLVARRTAFLVAVFGAGFGWFLIVLKYTVTGGELLFPLDVFVVEPNTFFAILASPHFVAAALYIAVFELVLVGHARQDYRYAWAAGILTLVLGWQHAYDLIIIYGVLFTFGVLVWLRDQRLPKYLLYSGILIGLLSWWPALYSVVLTSADPLWSQVLTQFANADVYTPPPWRLPILLGLPFLVALAAAWQQKPWRLQGKDDNALFLHGWFWSSFILIYLPVDYQIHMLNGWQIPIAILATMGLFQFVIPWFKRHLQPRRPGLNVQLASVALLIGISALTNVYLYSWRYYDISRYDYPYYLYRDEVDALRWLEQVVEPNDVVLSSLTLGQYIPAETGAHAVVAHWAQTVDYYTKLEAAETFFAPDTPDDQRGAILEAYRVRYVIYGPAERQLARGDGAENMAFNATTDRDGNIDIDFGAKLIPVATFGAVQVFQIW